MSGDSSGTTTRSTVSSALCIIIFRTGCGSMPRSTTCAIFDAASEILSAAIPILMRLIETPDVLAANRAAQ